MESKNIYIEYKYNNQIENYTNLLNIIYFLHIDVSYYLSLIYIISFPFLFEDNINNIYNIQLVYTLIYCNLLINFNNDYKKIIYLDIGYILLYLINNDYYNIFITSLFYILSISYIIFIFSSLYLYYYINNKLFDYIKYYTIGKPTMKYINNDKVSKIYIISLYDTLINFYHDCFNIG
jgi:hypothetical protein